MEKQTTSKKKMKKIKQETFLPISPIRDIDINEKKYSALYITFFIIVCALLLVCVISMIVAIQIWWVWLLDVCIYGYCFWACYCQFKKVKNEQVYTIYQNCIVIKSLLIDTIIKFEDICEVAPYKTLMDKLTNRTNHSIAIYLDPKRKQKVVIGFIEEDLQNLSDEIKALSEKFQQDNIKAEE